MGVEKAKFQGLLASKLNSEEGPKNQETSPSIDPKELLNSLREKQRLFAILTNEGLLRSEEYSKTAQTLDHTIADLENLIAQLEEK